VRSRNVTRSLLIASATALVASCGGSSSSVSKGLKIFVTARTHGGDFANDPFLTGANAIAKADDFCNGDPAKPSAATYKALLVDGVNRDAKTPVDWVLKPTTAYYQSRGDVLIGTTTATAVFGAAYQPLVNPISTAVTHVDGGVQTSQVWTGIGNATDFSGGETCNGWSDLTNAFAGNWGVPTARDATAFTTNGLVGCYYYQFPIYCVEQ
jgi:hypothetical protein